MNRTIKTQAQLQQHIEALITIEPQFATIYRPANPPTLRVREQGFRQLCQTIISQQLSVAVADSIWQKIVDHRLTNEKAILSSEDKALRALGLSKQKIRYLKSLAGHHIDYQHLNELPDEKVIDQLTRVTGIGRWTAEIYCLFSLKRSDIFAANDLALQIATQDFLKLGKRPGEATMRRIAAQWHPYRSAAAYLLWSHYAMIKQRQGIVT
ncbi:MAG: 3-methyladenine DNA glycosylase [Gammaproteobacteria bacterium]|nr:MAG: 3-methyladenine DNA glycosylase [Gammaproteobacteria bacterium]